MATITDTQAPLETSPTLATIPPLQNGDRLTRDEFLRRYEAMPHLKKAELIEGVVYMPSPVRHSLHGKPHGRLVNWLGHYVSFTPGTDFGDNGTIKLDLKNAPQPDAYAFIVSECGGRVRIDEKDYVVGGPDLVGEVAASSVSYDLHDKLEAYRRNQVKEYIVWRAEDKAIDWFLLRGDRFEAMVPSPDGFYKSLTFPGLWLDAAALLALHMPRVFEVVNMGLQTPEHAEFVSKLAAAAKNELR
jgi:Uma2 family endonuclease